jgi:hypothetical protein
MWYVLSFLAVLLIIGMCVLAIHDNQEYTSFMRTCLLTHQAYECQPLYEVRNF